MLRPGLLALVVVAAAALPASAQEQGRIPVGANLSITPGFTFVAGRDSNLIRTETGEAASEFYTVPQVEGWLGRGRTRVNFAGAVEYNAISAPSVQTSQINQFYSARAETGPARLRLSGLYSFRDHFAPPTDFVGFEIGLKSRRKETTYDLTATFSPGGRLSYNARAVRASLRYDADARYQGSSLRDNLNRDSDAAGGGFALALTPLTSIAAGAEVTRDTFLFATNRDGSGLRSFVGAQFKPLAIISGRAMAGYIRFTPKTVGAAYGGPYYRVGITTAHGPWVLNVDGTRSIDFSFDPSKGYFITTGVDLYTTVQAVRNLEVFVRGSIRDMVGQGLLALEEPNRGIRYFKTGAVYRLGRLVRLGVDAENYDFASNVPGGFKGLRVTTFLVYGIEKMQRLDRPLPGSF